MNARLILVFDTVCDMCKYPNKYRSILKTVTYITALPSRLGLCPCGLGCALTAWVAAEVVVAGQRSSGGSGGGSTAAAAVA